MSSSPRKEVPLSSAQAPPDDEPTDPGVGHAQVCEIGRVYGVEWEVTSLNSFGGQGEVYNVRHTRTGKPFAMKVLRRATREDKLARERFLQEGSVLQEFAGRYRSVVQVFQIGNDSDIGPYFVMELLNGNTLEHVAASGLPALVGLTAIVELAMVLEVVHEKGIIHRDLKPANIFVHQPESGPHILKLIDFGAMKGSGKFYIPTTKEGRFIGTPAFMPPEQIRGDRPTPRVDVYGLGMTGYAMLSGKSPFGADGFGQATLDELMLWSIAGFRVPLVDRVPHMPQELSDFVDKMIRARPEERFANMGEVVAAGRALLEKLRKRDADRIRHEEEDGELMRERIRAEIARRAEPAAQALGGMATAYNLHVAPEGASDPEDQRAVLAAQRALLNEHIRVRRAAPQAGVPVDVAALEEHVRELDAQLAALPARGRASAVELHPRHQAIAAGFRAHVAETAPAPRAVTERMVATPKVAPATAKTASPAPPPVAAAAAAKETKPAIEEEQRFASIVGLEGPFKTLAWEVARRLVRIGRDPSSDVVLEDASVSALHAQLKPAGESDDEGLKIVDADSSNGTFVNGEKVKEARLRDRDRISIGRVKLEYRLLGGQAVATVLRVGTPRTEKLGDQLPANWHEMTAGYREALDRSASRAEMPVTDPRRPRIERAPRRVGAAVLVGLLVLAAALIAYLLGSRK